MASVQMLPEGNWSLNAHTSKSRSLQNSFKLTFEIFNFSCTYYTLPKSSCAIFSTKIIMMM
jgi:hypothetical protein